MTKDDVVEALRQVEDPELGMDIVDLGLLYDVEIAGSKVKVIHSLTSMGCPAGPMIQEDIHRVASEIPGVEVKLGGGALDIKVIAAAASASAGCNSDHIPVFSGDSKVVGVSINSTSVC